jgi:hypothetical protein
MDALRFSSPGIYRIEVVGRFPSNWDDRFGCMQVLSSSLNNSRKEVASLQGKVSDQTELAGILNSFFEINLSLLSIQYLSEDLSQLDATQND